MVVVIENTNYAVKVTNAFKSYGENNVIKGLNMNVASGSVYGLLGSSGCGKSTLLQCILGMLTLDSGIVNLKAENLKDIGYMPQDLCLDVTLTIKESLEYFGALFNMNKKLIENRINEISTLLELPDKNCYINEISGGQSRRISLAICLLHDPKIIILDEPTVGIDPLLRQKIWAEFSRMVEEHKKTILITTHYIEEANKANCVGLMRNGMLIEEGTPQNIIEKYAADSLESAFLELCCNQHTNQIIRDNVSIKGPGDSVSQPTKLTEIEKQIDFNRINALFKKIFRVSYRDTALMFIMFILPIIQMTNICYGIGVNVKGLGIAVKNDEVNLSSCQYANVDGCIFEEPSNQLMSCVIVNHLTSLDYKLIEVKDHDTGEKALSDSNFVGFIHFPQNYTKDLHQLFDDRDNYAIQSQPYTQLTNHNFVFRNLITTDMLYSINYLIKHVLKECSKNPNSIGYPLAFDTLVGKEVTSFNNSIVPVFIVLAAFYCPTLFAVSLMISERMDGTLSRSMFAGVKILELLIALFIIVNFIILAEIAITIIIGYAWFSNPIQISSGLIAFGALLIFTGWFGFFSGIIIAGISPTKLGAVYVTNGLFMGQLFLSGGIWPIEGQPPFLRFVSQYLPLTIASKTSNDIVLKGMTLDSSPVLMGTTATFVYAILLTLVLFVLGKIKKDMWVVNN